MPELPEVEVTRRGISPHITGQHIERIDVRTPALRWPIPSGLDAMLAGRRVERVERRGKYLLIEVDTGWLIVHLGMTGTLRILPRSALETRPEKHDHVDIVFGECVLRLRDPRRFGAVLWHPREAGDVARHPLLLPLGVEPFSPEFTTQLLFDRTRGRSMSIKQALLAGDIVVGVGNIYASECLFRAGIHPARAAGRISKARYEKLAEAIRDTLAEAITKGGSTLRDFVGSDGARGYFQLDYFVYDRAGEPCRVCGTPIRQIVQGQRSTFYCIQCQR
ncbi:bifunctional DNA-formamidopyrimidine glycosylase/DNA-(apurinic or apyrimidinic site) lyase [Pararobbsia alpina]|uniref:Formamidopyrimidine-DNA glycosylase n=1 Tax=Pararobbsia alpina TaxID=621374 RepID=A0A6S7BH34_9BURK|nr:bifunctional DNA-formamidopyrimidine glycosylase/DNA-(apurinic or apyrimidinic site) lyase [Pararobbsia alpina]CAB3788382.1 Formamidopyrimidine-DNA glycosylase [Pararobbsia alpina]